MISTDLNLAINLLNSGEIIAIPTETVYGLAGNALNENALIKIFKAKKRPYLNPLITHIGRISQLSNLCKDIPNEAWVLIDVFWPGPLTLLLPKINSIPDLLTSGLEHLAVRMPSHPMALQLLKSIDYPLAAPSANPYKYVSPTSAQHVADQLENIIPLILDGGDCDIGLESTIIGFENNEVIVHRLGGITIEEIERTLKKSVILFETNDSHKYPGQNKKHYSPNKRITLIPFGSDLPRIHEEDTLISWLPSSMSTDSISADGTDISGASRLFSLLRDLDKKETRKIYIEKAPNIGLGEAINDRLKRAAYPS